MAREITVDYYNPSAVDGNYHDNEEKTESGTQFTEQVSEQPEYGVQTGGKEVVVGTGIGEIIEVNELPELEEVDYKFYCVSEQVLRPDRTYYLGGTCSLHGNYRLDLEKLFNTGQTIEVYYYTGYSDEAFPQKIHAFKNEEAFKAEIKDLINTYGMNVPINIYGYLVEEDEILDVQVTKGKEGISWTFGENPITLKTGDYAFKEHDGESTLEILSSYSFRNAVRYDGTETTLSKTKNGRLLSCPEDDTYIGFVDSYFISDLIVPINSIDELPDSEGMRTYFDQYDLSSDICLGYVPMYFFDVNEKRLYHADPEGEFEGTAYCMTLNSRWYVDPTTGFGAYVGPLKYTEITDFTYVEGEFDLEKALVKDEVGDITVVKVKKSTESKLKTMKYYYVNLGYDWLLVHKK